MTTLTSRNNPKLKQVRLLLQQRKARLETGLFVVEGIRHVGEAIDASAHVEYLCYAPDLLTSEYAHKLVQEQEKRGMPCYAVSKEIFVDLAEKDNPQGLLAVMRQPRLALDSLSPETHPWLIALVAPQDPGNIGSILRTIDAVGASGLLLLDDPADQQRSADPYHPSAVRASMGALFWHPLVNASFPDFTRWAKQHAYHIYGTSAHAAQDYRQVHAYQSPLILLLGTEREGLTPEQAAVCDSMLCMPMKGRVTSLNLSIATGIMLYAILDKLDAPQ
jgi:RNA methyltransferase, TrmH family